MRGTTDYGDSVEDEWLIVYILREFSKSHPAAWVRVFDADGEFLLVEAANVLPRWLSPEIDQNRVWINNGRLRIIPQTPGTHLKASLLTPPDAVDVIRSNAGSLIHSEFIEAEAFYRLEKYPGQIQKSLHHSLVTIPRRLAFVLHQIPKAVAPAVDAFYLRDALDLKDLLSRNNALQFPPSDLVTLSVKFTKVLFAQLRSQRFEPPTPWAEHTQQAKGTERSRIEMGMKLACGFEIMLNNIDKTDSREAREAGIIVEDLKADGDSVLPKDGEISTWEDSLREDDESWMDINYEDFEKELSGRQEGSRVGSSAGFGDATTQADLRKIVSRFEAFLNDETAGLDGAEVDEMDVDDDDDEDSGDDMEDEDEDKEVSFDEVEFSRLMREMMGLAPTKPLIPSESGRTTTTVDQVTCPGQAEDADEEPNDEELRKLTAQLEAELKEYGALNLAPPRDKTSTLEGKGKENVSVGGRDMEGRGDNEEDGEDEEDGEVDIDYNLAKNLLESFKGQAGMPGPTGNILGMMGLHLPRDEDNSNTANGMHE